MGRGAAGFLRDNLEAFAVAIAMALVIRHYCLEAFRIPTDSMKPTLLGDHAPYHGDRILVDKFVYQRREPRRFEVIVFRYPLNARKNFIKRLGGLPGEWLRIVDGDLWVSTDEGASWTIQRKPPNARDQLFFPYYPDPYGKPGAFRKPGVWIADPGWSVEGAPERIEVDAGEQAARLEFARRVVSFPSLDDRRYAGEDDGRNYRRDDLVGDVRMRLRVRVERAGELTLLLQEHAQPHRVVLGPEGSHAVVVREGIEHRYPLDVRLAQGQEFDLSVANVDDTLVLDLAGDVDLHEEIDFPEPADQQPPVPEEGNPRERPQFSESDYGDHRIALEATRLRATFEEIFIDRDVHYDPRRSPHTVWKIPEGHYFALGDNTESSHDSREWTVEEAHLESGEVVRWERPRHNDPWNNPIGGDPGGAPDAEVFVEVDVNGLTRRFLRSEVERWATGVRYPYVPRDNLVGRAFAVFWPIYVPPIYSGPTRIDLIR